MTSRERLLAVIKHQIPDRVPVSTYELVGWRKNSWENSQSSYGPLMDYIREKTDCLYMTDVDNINEYVENHTHIKEWKEGISTFMHTTLSTPKGDISKLDRFDENINTVWHLEPFIKNDDDIDRYLSIPAELLPVETENLKMQDTLLEDRGILLISIADPLCIAAELFHFGDFTMKAYTDRCIFTKLLDKLYEQQIFYLEDMLKKGAGPLFRIIGPEYATPPYLSPELFHEYVCKYDKKMIKMIHGYSQFARIHCHGRIREIPPHIMEMEADAVDPVEAPPSGDIELKEVKNLYGDKLCLMGNIQLRDLETLSSNEVRALVIKCMEDGKSGGNFVIMPTASPINVPINPKTDRNYRSFIDTALEYGVY